MQVYYCKYETSKHVSKKPYQRMLTDVYWFCVDGQGFMVEAGFWWDGSSQPKFLWSMVGSPFTGKYYFGTLIHDILYATHYFSRDKADEIMYIVLRMEGVGYIKANAMYQGVRAGGWVGWDKTPKQIAGAAKHLFVRGMRYSPIVPLV